MKRAKSPMDRIAQKQADLAEREQTDPEFAAWISQVRRNIDARVARSTAGHSKPTRLE